MGSRFRRENAVRKEIERLRMRKWHLTLERAYARVHENALRVANVTTARLRPLSLIRRYAKTAKSRGLKVIVAGAGGAAHLPGMVAAMTSLPVIGVPVKTSTLSGVDSLYSIVQMPRGVPVATVAIGNATNAGILAAKILAIGNDALSAKIESFMASQTDEVMEKAKTMEKMGWRDYLTMYEKKKRQQGPKKDTAVGV